MEKIRLISQASLQMSGQFSKVNIISKVGCTCGISKVIIQQIPQFGAQEIWRSVSHKMSYLRVE